MRVLVEPPAYPTAQIRSHSPRAISRLPRTIGKGVGREKKIRARIRGMGVRLRSRKKTRPTLEEFGWDVIKRCNSKQTRQLLHQLERSEIIVIVVYRSEIAHLIPFL